MNLNALRSWEFSGHYLRVISPFFFLMFMISSFPHSAQADWIAGSYESSLPTFLPESLPAPLDGHAIEKERMLMAGIHGDRMGYREDIGWTGSEASPSHAPLESSLETLDAPIKQVPVKDKEEALRKEQPIHEALRMAPLSSSEIEEEQEDLEILAGESTKVCKPKIGCPVYATQNQQFSIYLGPNPKGVSQEGEGVGMSVRFRIKI